MNLSGTILRLARRARLQTFTVTRFGLTTYDHGRAIDPVVSTFTIQALIQPAGLNEVIRLPEGERSRKTIAIYTPTPLHHARANDAPSDRIAYGDELFEVSSIDEWDVIAGYIKALATKVQDLTDAGSLEEPTESPVIG